MKRLFMLAAAAVIAVMLVPADAYSDQAPTKRKRVRVGAAPRVAALDVRPGAIRRAPVGPRYAVDADEDYPVAVEAVPSAYYGGYRYGWDSGYRPRDAACMAWDGYQWIAASACTAAPYAPSYAPPYSYRYPW